VTPSSRVRPLLATLGLLVGAWAGAVWLTGGVAFTVAGLRVSSRSTVRPAVLAAVLAASALWGWSTDHRRRYLAAVRQRGDRLAPWAAALVALALALTSAAFGGHVAGASDASGYVSQSRLWAAGRVRVPAPALTADRWPDRGWLVAPLGYAPSHVEGELGPTYAPGLPWLMAVGAAVAGEAGRYLWTPLFAGLLAWGTFLLAQRAAPPLVAFAAAALVATSPPVLFAAMQTMSDVPAAALWLGALLLLGSPRASAPLLSGTLAALALVVRPNLVLVAGVMWLTGPVAGPAGSTRARGQRAVLWAAPVAIGAGAIAVVNSMLWGSPAASGYGANADLFQAAHVPHNLANLWRWTVQTHGYWCVLALLALPWTLGTQDRRRAWPAAALVATVALSYLVYAVFVEWWYLRFYLPAWPVLAATAATAAWRLLARWTPDGAALIVVAVALAHGITGVRDAAAVGAFELWTSEQRYAAVAEFVRDAAPANAVVLTVQHSGAVAYYARRTIGRWDVLPADALDAFCVRLAAAGRDTWLVVDDWEEPPFRQRFAGAVRGRLDWAPVGEARVGPTRVRVYDLTTPTRAVGPALIPVTTSLSWPWTRIHAPGTAK